MFSRKSLYAAVSVGALLACGPIAAEVAVQKTDEATKSDVDIVKLSQAFGNFIGKNLKTSGLNFDIDSLVLGIKEGAAGKPSPLSEQEYERGMLSLQERALKKIAEDNLQAADKFLKENASKPNIVVVEPGKLQYEVIKQGSGNVVQEHTAPTINYKGQYIDGTVFGSSEEAGGPITLPLDQTIPGFAKAIVGMKEGEKRKLFVHPDLGYGTSGQLPPNSLLIFEVEVVKATDQDADDDDDSDTPKKSPLAQNDATKPNGKSDSDKKASSSDDDSDEDDDDYDDDDDNNDDEDAEDTKSKPTTNAMTPNTKK